MDDYIKQIEALIDTNTAMKERTPWLDSSRGSLRQAIEHATSHVEAMAKKATAPAQANPEAA